MIAEPDAAASCSALTYAECDGTIARGAHRSIA
ncbi:Uncharacterised protein [Mycobacteroides abscessus subsp. abscessus]|nr:Uncharacterised protein [Mycobacteroides abscessus subsp. abscessus]